jgi:hypothetical protein
LTSRCAAIYGALAFITVNDEGQIKKWKIDAAYFAALKTLSRGAKKMKI